MPKTNTKFVRALELAVDLRAAGLNWDQVANRVHRKIDDVRQWPHTHADLWDRRMAIALRQQDVEAVGQARHLLRRQMGNDDVKIAREAAHILLAFARGRLEPLTDIAPVSSPFHRIADELEGMSHEQLCQYVDAEFAKHAGRVPEAASADESV